jgi:hypothetical protein
MTGDLRRRAAVVNRLHYLAGPAGEQAHSGVAGARPSSAPTLLTARPGTAPNLKRPGSASTLPRPGSNGTTPRGS